jgi:two-component system LytT family response regulator
MSLRVVIVDDEPLARERVRTFLAEEADIEIVAECGDGADAVNQIEKLRPDVLFLDVQMPRLNGFEVLAALDADAMPAVVFTTAHDDHAIRAFEVSAVDYLLKPFKQPRFCKALERARAQVRSATGGSKAVPQLSKLLSQWREGAGDGPRVLVKSPDRILFLKPAEIDHIEACGNYVVLHVGKDKHIVRETMTAMETRLEPSGFMRINRSVILNLSRIKELQPVAAGEYVVILRSGVRLNMTCSLRDLQARMNQA